VRITDDLIYKSVLNGGMTFNHIKDKVKTGFMVSQRQTEKVVDVDTFDKLKQDIQDYVDAHTLKDNQYFGLWYNDGKCYIDISTRIATKKQAIALGKQENQLAIFDNKNLKVIEL
jgi:hypothetical protein